MCVCVRVEPMAAAPVVVAAANVALYGAAAPPVGRFRPQRREHVPLLRRESHQIAEPHQRPSARQTDRFRETHSRLALPLALPRTTELALTLSRPRARDCSSRRRYRATRTAQLTSHAGTNISARIIRMYNSPSNTK